MMGVATDRLPYTNEFDSLYGQWVIRTDVQLSRSQFWHMLTNARKRGQLPSVS
jgi:hypothetical protein